MSMLLRGYEAILCYSLLLPNFFLMEVVGKPRKKRSDAGKTRSKRKASTVGKENENDRPAKKAKQVRKAAKSAPVVEDSDSGGEDEV
ncbi:hypothetical protein PLICRDRAFT_45098 [Plicaturopsis crispa FD-325 SS-3]|nr:hypothetical protein PLICRDRAFT_45098 [Plicaturopsis crispa FD-325 SS-3]